MARRRLARWSMPSVSANPRFHSTWQECGRRASSPSAETARPFGIGSPILGSSSYLPRFMPCSAATSAAGNLAQEVAMDNFNPVSALIGGLLIGTAAALLLIFNGKISGVSGILGGLFQ